MFKGLLVGFNNLEIQLVTEVVKAFMVSENGYLYKQLHFKDWLKSEGLDLVRVKLALQVLGFKAVVVESEGCGNTVTLEVSLNE